MGVVVPGLPGPVPAEDSVVCALDTTHRFFPRRCLHLHSPADVDPDPDPDLETCRVLLRGLVPDSRSREANDVHKGYRAGPPCPAWVSVQRPTKAVGSDRRVPLGVCTVMLPTAGPSPPRRRGEGVEGSRECKSLRTVYTRTRSRHRYRRSTPTSRRAPVGAYRLRSWSSGLRLPQKKSQLF